MKVFGVTYPLVQIYLIEFWGEELTEKLNGEIYSFSSQNTVILNLLLILLEHKHQNQLISYVKSCRTTKSHLRPEDAEVDGEGEAAREDLLPVDAEEADRGVEGGVALGVQLGVVHHQVELRKYLDNIPQSDLDLFGLSEFEFNQWLKTLRVWGFLSITTSCFLISSI